MGGMMEECDFDDGEADDSPVFKSSLAVAQSAPRSLNAQPQFMSLSANRAQPPQMMGMM